MTAAELLADHVCDAIPPAGAPVEDWRTFRRRVVEMFDDVARVSTQSKYAVEEIACDHGWCRECGATGKVERSPTQNANDPRRERVPCPECKGVTT